jgi:hypothetical protein
MSRACLSLSRDTCDACDTENYRREVVVRRVVSWLSDSMRSICLAIALFTAACATTSGPRPVNVAAVRHDINDAIKSQNGDRTIHSMGKTTTDRAVVYTTAKDGTKKEEVWIKDPSGWKQEGSTAVSGTPTTEGM